MKGTDRTLRVNMDGSCALVDDLPANAWVTLAGFAFNAFTLVDDAVDARDDVDGTAPPEPSGGRDEL